MRQQLILSVPSKNIEAFVFGVASGTEYETLSTTSQGGWVNLDIMDGKAVSQNTHVPLDGKVTKGKWFGAEGRASIRRLREIMRLRVPVLLTDDYGYNIGMYKMMSLNDEEKDVIDDGTPMVIVFSITFEEFAN
ncbi:TPA: phage tail protein [Vibrio parahaemolyticus]|nr:phage tail protein [Vibrio parahaemolyticus]MBE4060362.1 hypothetical protein [Vibrio parahaemolyticus]MBE4428671.1 hypothetical protein [Vibrio parahaemolyticus]HCG9061901.1 phage tail protein [Vibrio parahaemolyticus]